DPFGGFRRPVRWKKVNSFAEDLFAGETNPGEATATSSNGTRIVGQADMGSGPQAFYYTDSRGMVMLDTITHNFPFDQSFANGVSDKGMVVGWTGDPWGPDGSQAFYWRAKKPSVAMRPLRDLFIAAGANIPSQLSLTTALAISADGSTIVGIWQDDQYN